MRSALIVFSHLRWDSMFQRPQQLLSRLAGHRPVVFVEEPVHHQGPAFLKTYAPLPNVLVCRPHSPVQTHGFHDDHLPHLQELVRKLRRDYPHHIAWFHTPMALPLLQELDPELVVYDCIDEPAVHRNAPRQLAQREGALLKRADLVFTAGPSLYRANRKRHANVHCFAGSVSAAEFLPALDRTNSHPLHRDIPGPRLGYYGVIDERFDADLMRAVADAHPRWQIVLVGPVMGEDASALPQRPNIHYLGQQADQDLPRFLAGWDVCLLPYKCGAESRFLNPPSTLEYMAAELPIVSTPLPDVAELYGEVVAIADGSAPFVAACEQALLAGPQERDALLGKMRVLVAAASWDKTLMRMHALLDTTTRARVAVPGADVGMLPLDAAADIPQINPRHMPALMRPGTLNGDATAGAAVLACTCDPASDGLLLKTKGGVSG